MEITQRELDRLYAERFCPHCDGLKHPGACVEVWKAQVDARKEREAKRG